MYGHIASTPLAAVGMLVDGAHSLITQSCRDWRGETHRDGWGIGYYEGEQPRTVRRPTAAPDDPEFVAAAGRIASPMVMGHVRQASVGDLCPANVHPFTCGRWMFAHNGTVTGYDILRPVLVDETDFDLRQHVGGTTDSEQVFFWILSRLRRAGQAILQPCGDVNLVATEMAAAIRLLDARSASTGPSEPTRLNFLLTDGVVLLASRWKHSLWWTNRNGPFDRIVATAGNRSRTSRGVAVASEPIGDQAWAEVPDGHVLSVDADFIVRWLRI
ncbi:MAG TPA: class II glutamine amidotransferase [Pirellulales bacterium]